MDQDASTTLASATANRLKKTNEIRGVAGFKIHIGKAVLITCTASGEVCGTASPELAKAIDKTLLRLFVPYQAL